MSVCPFAWNSSASAVRIFIKFDVYVFFENLSGKLKFDQIPSSITRTLHEAQYALMTISR